MSNKTAPKKTDDLTRITGVGAAIEKRLHKAGVRTFSQLAELDSSAIYALVSDVAGYSPERIAEEDWPGQARELALESTALKEAESDPSPPEDGQHDVSFTLKLLLNEDHSVRRTQLVDNRSKTEEQWAGWDERRIIGFVSQKAALKLPAVEPPIPVAMPTELEPAAATVAEPVVTTPALAGFGDRLHLRELEVIPVDATTSRRVFRHDLPFSVRLHLDLTEAALLGGDPLEYTATVHAKRLGGGPREIVGEVHHTVPLQEQLTILVAGKPLPAGSYRLEAIVTLSHPSAELDLKAYQEGGMLQVY